jgi:murein DD-endopeptidase MepM/ murein hydrolase activator NlpD
VKSKSFPALLAGVISSFLLTACSASASSTPSPVLLTPEPSPSATPQSLAVPTDHPTAAVSLPCTPDLCIRPGDFPLSRPILPPGNDRVESKYRYGYTQSGAREPHHGVEFTNPEGTPVQAAADGTVFYAGNDSTKVFGLYPDFYGNLVLLQHDLPGYANPIYTLYAHLSSIAVQTGQEVTRGDPIGAVGLSGSADGAHLHFEVRLGEPDYNHTTNPELFIPPLPSVETSTPTGILIGRIEDEADETGSPLTIPITVQPLDQNGIPGPASYPEIYGAGVPSSPQWNENFLAPDLPAGKYRVAFVDYSRVFEQIVEVIPGDITFVKISAKP